MYDHDDSNVPPNQPHLNTLSRNRPPQFNWRNCGFDCGLGCEKASDGEGGGGGEEEGESDGETTAVDEHEIGNLTAESQAGSSHHDGHLGSSLDDDPSQHAVEEEFPIHVEPSDLLDEMSGSLHVGRCATMDHSPEASAMISTSPDPGISYWLANPPVAPELPFEYYFLETPLRLSPQYEHCRGDPASHLVVPDRTSWAFLVEQTWRGYMPAYGYVSPPHVEGW
jgi:hypothetical protein